MPTNRWEWGNTHRYHVQNVDGGIPACLHNEMSLREREQTSDVAMRVGHERLLRTIQSNHVLAYEATGAQDKARALMPLDVLRAKAADAQRWVYAFM